MRIGIDSYCYHRFFGELYAGLEQPPDRSMSLLDVVDRAHTYGAEGVALESFMLGDLDPAMLKERLDRFDLYRMWAWGHPHGLGSGTMPEALTDLTRHVEIAASVGADVMRICAGGRRTRKLTWAEHRPLLLPLLRRAADHAGERGVVLAIENHVDLSTDEMLDLVTTIDHPALGICLDTANQLRMFEDPAVAAERMAPYARAVHFKDVTAYRGSPREFGFWPSVPTGEGLIDFPRVLRALARTGYDGLLALELDYLHPAYGSEDDVIIRSLDRMRALRTSMKGIVEPDGTDGAARPMLTKPLL